jgi:hypothetical protein
MKIKYIKWIIIMAFIVMAIPFFLYFKTFFGSLSNNDQNWANFGSYIGGLISSIFSFASFIILILNFIYDRDTINKSRTIEYLKHTNIFISEINHIIINIENIRHYSKYLLKDNYDKMSIITDNDFRNICSRINILREYLNDNRILFDKQNTNNKMYFDLIMKNIDEIINPDLFIKICTKFENNAINYYYMIDRPLRNQYKILIKTIQEVSKNGMSNFNIVEFKTKLVDHIYLINENILEKKIDRSKDLFDN